MEDMGALVNSLRAGRSYERVEPYEDFYWTPALLSSKLHVAQKTVWRWIHEGHLRAYRVGRLLRIPNSALLEFLERGQTTRVLVLARGSPTDDFAKADARLSSAHTIGSHGSVCLSCSLGV